MWTSWKIKFYRKCVGRAGNSKRRNTCDGSNLFINRGARLWHYLLGLGLWGLSREDPAKITGGAGGTVVEPDPSYRDHRDE